MALCHLLDVCQSQDSWRATIKVQSVFRRQERKEVNHLVVMQRCFYWKFGTHLPYWLLGRASHICVWPIWFLLWVRSSGAEYSLGQEVRLVMVHEPIFNVLL